MLLHLTWQIVMIFVLGFISINIWMFYQMHQMMKTHPTQMDTLLLVGMHSSMLATTAVMPILAAVIVLIVWRSLRPLRQFSQFFATHPVDEFSEIPITQLPTEVRELTQFHQRLISALTEAGAQQRQFINHVSHELRTPLSLVYGYLQQTLRRHTNLTDAQREALSVAATETEHMVQILQDLSNLARAKNKIPLHLEPLVLNEVVAAATRITASRRSLIQVEAASATITVKADRERLTQIIIHLIDHAIKRSEENQTVTLQLKQTGSWVTMQVSTRSTDDMELELMILDALVKPMGGQASVQSQPSHSNMQVKLPAW